jgi:hypothetical protein
MSSSISHLSINEQQAAAVSAKRKKDDTAVMAQATTATAHREYEATRLPCTESMRLSSLP